MIDLAKEMGAEEWPKGLYMVFQNGTKTIMGKVIGLTNKTVFIHPWDYHFGGLDDDVIMEIVLADVGKFFPFDDIWDMYQFHIDNFEKQNNGERND
jgi:hypothetical protein